MSLYRLDGNTIHIDDPAAIVRHLQDNPQLPLLDQRMFAAMLLIAQRRKTPKMLEGVTVDSFLNRIRQVV
jgi:hypothetical protein